MEIASSSSTSMLCTVCHVRTQIYTCPRCQVRTCSAQCSSQHKKVASCSGVRDRAAYVPMNAYSWGTMMDDYVFLEDVGRIVETHGATISRGGFTAKEPRGRGRGRGRARGPATAAVVGGNKKDTLKMQLGFKNISIDFLPEGMEKRRLNQSRWDARENLAFLTVEFIIHPPSAMSPKEEVKQFKVLTHRNNLSTPISRILMNYLKNSKEGRSESPSWLSAILSLSFDETSPASSPATPLFLLPQYPPRPQPLRQPQRNSYRRFANPYHILDPTQSLLQGLRSRAFLEYPTIEIVPPDDAGHIIYVDDSLSSSDDVEEWDGFSKRKRRRMEPQKTCAKQGGQRLVGLLSGYSSDKDGNEDAADSSQGDQGAGTENDKGVLGLLGYESDGDAPSDQHLRSEDEDGDDNNVIVCEESVDPVASLRSIDTGTRTDPTSRGQAG